MDLIYALQNLHSCWHIGHEYIGSSRIVALNTHYRKRFKDVKLPQYQLLLRRRIWGLALLATGMGCYRPSAICSTISSRGAAGARPKCLASAASTATQVAATGMHNRWPGTATCLGQASRQPDLEQPLREGPNLEGPRSSRLPNGMTS